MDKINFALIGLGPVGEYNHLPILLKNNKINLVGICDKNITKLNLISKKFNLKGYTNFKKMINENKIDVIIHNKDVNEVSLLVRRSFSNHLWSWLNDSARFL